MFNIGSFEVLLIFIIALLVLGPERLPGAVRTTGLWIGRFRRSFYKVKNEIEKELNVDEIRRQLHNETVMAEIKDAKSSIEGIAKDTEKSVNNIVNSANFDPGASQASADTAKKNSEQESAAIESLAKNDKSLTGELKEISNQVEEVTKQIYSGGKNPKLVNSDTSIDTPDIKKENGNS
ncbi:MAG: twin-arginine translocase subunit TatB [Gammaproteobacteria bacterium]|nr:twin-arginine translocase subunit TatB [Gammaproteobacteria bacterium]